MVKNTYLKKAFKKVISPILSCINQIIPKNDKMILLYSANKGINFNLTPVRDYLIKENYNNNNSIICSVESMEYKEEEVENITYVKHLRGVLIFFRARHVFYTTGMIPIKPSKNQIVIQLDHGTAFKAVNAMSNINNGDEFYFTYHIAASDAYIPSICKRYGCTENNIIIDGEPVLDRMLASKVKYELGDFKKIILWAPTFRQSDYFGYDDSEESLLPMFENNQYDKLNMELKKYRFRLIVKLHPGQDVDILEKTHYSNLDIFTSDEFEKRGWNLYDLLPQIDYLFADYSSVFVEYLLLDKPMCFIIPDFEEYAEKRGFSFDNPLQLMPGPKVKTKEELFNVLKDLNDNIDNYADDRLRVKKYIHKYSDGRNTERIIKISQIKK